MAASPTSSGKHNQPDRAGEQRDSVTDVVLTEPIDNVGYILGKEPERWDWDLAIEALSPKTAIKMNSQSQQYPLFPAIMTLQKKTRATVNFLGNI